ncbi:hypothetical protein pEaSNUABM37_00191 [Erwinia phage pEa_SNUABM_37]|nr:hypothetical protein pEaSNUABM37_00191 [Erwinia phage pEa_SNUABM_37]QXO10661.1 hypothetical protein pEaSNUABM48_00191 [Erwinia phage pEa_SNUABM_48]
MASVDLVNHAIENAWANPQADRQHVLRLARVSRDVGDINYSLVMNNPVYLPTRRELYHVFQIGQNHPWTWNVGDNYVTPLPIEEWVALSDLRYMRMLVANVYLDTGIQLPATGVFVRLRYDHNILIAITDFQNMSVPRNVEVYMRVYSNAYFESLLEEERIDMIQCFGGMMSDPKQVLRWQNDYLNLKNSGKGSTQAFVNGELVEDFPPGSYRQRDYVTVSYDASVFKVVDIPVKTMPTFLSTLDNRQKYIFHPPRLFNEHDLDVVFFDDLDFWLIGPTGKGVYFHRNMRDAVRQLTHRDYALCVAYLQNLVTAHGWGQLNDCTVRCVMRRSGFEQTLVHEAHRIRELYKLPDNLIIDAMVNVRATLPEWSAAELERSKYVQLLGTQYNALSSNLVRDAYGYNAMTQVMANTPVLLTKGETSNNYANLSPSLRENVTVYEYDEDGLYLGNYYQSGGVRYIARNANAAIIEVYSGKASKSPHYVLGNASVPLLIEYGYRVYQADWDGTVIDETSWRDVTGLDTVYAVVNGQLNWLHNKNRYVGLVLMNDVFLGYDFELDHMDKTLAFSLTYDWTGGGLEAPIAPGTIDIIMNGHSLIPGIDYIENYPRYVITGKKYLVDGPQKFTIRATGWGTIDLKPQPANEYGWVTREHISNNHVYNLRDDRTVRCVIAGRIVRREDLVYAEDVPSAADLDPSYNGQPYYIGNVMASVRNVNDYETFPLRDKSMDLDGRLSAFLTSIYPQPDLGNPNFIQQKYVNYSPLLQKLIYDLKLGFLILPSAGWGSDEKLDKILEPYKWWMDFDPCTKEMDWTYVFVEPHNQPGTLGVTSLQYDFLNRVIDLYLNKRTTLSGYLTITAG